MVKLISGAFSVLTLALALAGCGEGSGDPVLTLPGSTDGVAGDFYLPAAAIADSGIVALTDGAFAGAGNSLVLTEAGSGASVTVADTTRFASTETIYDTDGDNDLDYIVLTIRPMSMQAAQSVRAVDAAGAAAGGSNFYKIGGIAVLPLTAQTNQPVAITVPVNTAGTPAAGKAYELYRWVSGWDGPLDEMQGSPGYWAFVKTVNVDSNGTSVTFSVSQLGQYAVVTRVVTAPAPPPAAP